MPQKPLDFLCCLKEGQQASIEGFMDDELALKLIEMGCLPGETITLRHKAPLGCPVTIELESQTLLSIRRSEASQVQIKRK